MIFPGRQNSLLWDTEVKRDLWVPEIHYERSCGMLKGKRGLGNETGSGQGLWEESCIWFQVHREITGGQHEMTTPPSLLRICVTPLLEWRKECLSGKQGEGVFAFLGTLWALKELCVLRVMSCNYGSYNSGFSTINIVKWPSKENLKKECFQRKFWLECLWSLQIWLFSLWPSSSDTAGMRQSQKKYIFIEHLLYAQHCRHIWIVLVLKDLKNYSSRDARRSTSSEQSLDIQPQGA